MKQAHKKRPPRATANSPPGLPDMGGILFYKSVKISKANLDNLKVVLSLHIPRRKI